MCPLFMIKVIITISEKQLNSIFIYLSLTLKYQGKAFLILALAGKLELSSKVFRVQNLLEELSHHE